MMPTQYIAYLWVAKRTAACHHCDLTIREGDDWVGRAYPRCCDSHAWKIDRWTNKAPGTGNFICEPCIKQLGLEIRSREHPEDTGTQEALI